jgi:hypothetical protein
MYYARAYERRAAAFLPAQQQQQRGTRPPARPNPRPGGVPSLGSSAAVPQAPSSSATGQQRFFRRLSSAEQLECHQKGLCINCDESYVRGHVCQRLFYLENDNYVDDDVPTEVAAAAVFQ